MNSKKATLIYDGDCPFCRRNVENWRSKLEEQVDIKSYQEAIEDFPNLSAEECKESIKLVHQGNIYSGAHAVFKAFALNGERKSLLWLYEHVPLVSPISEKVYHFVARRRSTFSKFYRD